MMIGLKYTRTMGSRVIQFLCFCPIICPGDGDGRSEFGLQRGTRQMSKLLGVTSGNPSFLS